MRELGRRVLLLGTAAGSCTRASNDEAPPPPAVAERSPPMPEPAPAEPEAPVAGPRNHAEQERGAFECASKPTSGWADVPVRRRPRLVDACAIEILVGLEIATGDHGENEWEAPRGYPELPFVRLVKGKHNRYPNTAIVDAHCGVVVDAVDANVMTQLIQENGATIRSKRDAEALGRAFLALHHPSYVAQNVEVQARQAEDRFVVSGTYEQTQPWSPEEGSPLELMIAGSRTALHGFELTFTHDGHVSLNREEELRELRTSPPRRPRVPQ